jgi:hypothetical protein
LWGSSERAIGLSLNDGGKVAVMFLHPNLKALMPFMSERDPKMCLRNPRSNKVLIKDLKAVDMSYLMSEFHALGNELIDYALHALRICSLNSVQLDIAVHLKTCWDMMEGFCYQIELLEHQRNIKGLTERQSEILTKNHADKVRTQGILLSLDSKWMDALKSAKKVTAAPSENCCPKCGNAIVGEGAAAEALCGTCWRRAKDAEHGGGGAGC